MNVGRLAGFRMDDCMRELKDDYARVMVCFVFRFTPLVSVSPSLHAASRHLIHGTWLRWWLDVSRCPCVAKCGKLGVRAQQL